MKQIEYITVENDLQLYVETYGDPCDEGCLFLSGAGANSSFWSDQFCHRLADQGFFVITYDHRDFGYSSKINWDERPYDFIQLVNDALTVLDVLEVEKAHMVGHSMGGFIVQLLGIHYSHRVISMISISSSTSSDAVPKPPEQTWDIFLSNKPTGDLTADMDGFLKVWKYLNGTATFDEELAITYTKNLYQRQLIDGALGASHVKAQATLTDRTEQLKKIKLPALVIHGKEDFAVVVYGGILTAEAIENAQLIVIPEMGHMPFNYKTLERLEYEIIKFLRRNKLADTH